MLLYEETYRKDINFVLGDVRDKKKLKPNLDWADTVVWLAALVGDGACQLNPERSTEINQDSVKWLSENFDGRIIFTSTASVYGARDGELGEDAPTNPLSVYASTKLKAEDYLKDKNAVIFRLGTLYGVSDRFSRIRFDLVVNVLVKRAYAINTIQVFGGDQFRPILHVRDAARAIKSQLNVGTTGIFNIRDQNIRIIDLAHQVRGYFPDVEFKITDMNFEDARNYRLDDSKMREVLGFTTQHTVDSGIREIKELLENVRIKDADDDRYVNEVFLSTRLKEE